MNKAFADIIGLEQLNASAAVLFATRQINRARYVNTDRLTFIESM